MPLNASPHRSMRLALLCLLAGWLCAACGWHLQGVTRLPETTSVVYIDAFDRYSDFSQNLQRRLVSAGARVVNTAAEAKAVIRVRGEDFGHTVVSVSALNIPQEYQAFYQVDYSVELQGKEVIAPQTVRLSHNFSYDEKAMLGKQIEEDGLRASLSRDLVEQVMRRLAAL